MKLYFDRSKGFNTRSALFLIIYQLVLLISLPFYFYYAPPSGGLIAVSVVLLYLTGLSITGGYHRLWAHRTYKLKPVIEAIVLFFGSMAVQGSVLRWACDHRIHHAKVDTDEDPYSIKKGFWYAHFLWMMEKPGAIDPKVVADLMRNKLVMFQHNHIVACTLLSNLLVFFLVGFFFGDFLGAFVLATWTRMFFLHHFTWFINSLAHTWGDKPFSQELSAVDNYFLSMLTFGEGYHNYHHTFANDYRNGIKWYHFDPTKWLIWTLHKLGLAVDLKRMSQDAIKRKMILEEKSLLIDRITTFWHAKKEELEHQVNELSERLMAKIGDFNQLKEQYRQYKREQKHEMLATMKRELKSLEKSLKEDWQAWVKLSRNIYQQPQT